MLKVMTLNLWRYHEWDKRIDAIVSLINEVSPGCVAFQEVVTNHAFSDVPASEIIAEQCGYEYRSFAPTLARNDSKDRDGNRTQHVSEGQAFISKFPIVKTEGYFLHYYGEYPEEKAVLFCSVKSEAGNVDFCNVHFANSDVAYKHLDELLMLNKQRKAVPIILGDFNIYKLAEYKDKNDLLKAYALSSELLDYVSFPADNDSLDYIVAPSSKYDLSNVQCSDAKVSDHRALIADISVK